jgi:hypothetical protein
MLSNEQADKIINKIKSHPKKEKDMMLVSPIAQVMSRLLNTFELVEKAEVFDEENRTALLAAWKAFDIAISTEILKIVTKNLGEDDPMVRILCAVTKNKLAKAGEANDVQPNS